MKHHFTIALLVTTLFTTAFGKDTDGDLISDDAEIKIGTSPNRKDSDGDGSTDYDEIRFDCNPLDPKEKIIEIGDWQKSSKLASMSSRKAKVSYNGKIVTNVDYFIGYPERIERAKRYQSLLASAQVKKMDQARKNAFRAVNVDLAEREKYLAMSHKYDDIKRLREERKQRMHAYNKSKNETNLAAYNKAIQAVRDLERSELKNVKARITTAGYRPKSKLEKLEDRIEELEDELDRSR